MVSIDILKRSSINTVRYSIDKIYTEFIEHQGNQHFQFSLAIIDLMLLPGNTTVLYPDPFMFKEKKLKSFLLVLYFESAHYQ